MAKIKRYKLESEYETDETFEVRTITKTTTVVETIQETDEFGNVISARHMKEPITHPVQIQEGIKAIALPSKTKAKVTILETTDGLTEDGIKEGQEQGRQRPTQL